MMDLTRMVMMISPLALAWNNIFIIAFMLALLVPDAYAQETKSRLGVLGAESTQAVELRALNKLTARSSLIQVNIGDIERFDTIELHVRSCWSAPIDQRPEHKALLKITEVNQGERPEELFHGWMFASSPALNTLEHPLYDIAVERCLKERVKTN